MVRRRIPSRSTTYVLDVRISEDGQLVARQSGSAMDAGLGAVGRSPNQFDRNPGGSFGLEARYAFMTQAQLDEWKAFTNAIAV
jgi:hypothetical protein